MYSNDSLWLVFYFLLVNFVMMFSAILVQSSLEEWVRNVEIDTESLQLDPLRNVYTWDLNQIVSWIGFAKLMTEIR